MKKYLNKFFAFAIIMSLLLPSFFTVKTCAKDYDTYSIQCSGKYQHVNKDIILKELNRIRKEACDENIKLSNGRVLKPSDYVPLKWSKKFEQFSSIRAVEASLVMDHTRPNGKVCFSVANGYSSYVGENLAWNSVGLMTGIKQFYSEKSELIKKNNGQNYGQTGHYENIINPSFTHVALSSYKLDGAYFYTTAQFLGVDMNAVEENYITTDLVNVEVSDQFVVDKKINVEDKLLKGKDFDLEVLLTLKESEWLEKSKCQNTDNNTFKLSENVNFTSSDENVVKIVSNNKLKALKTGKATITANIDGKKIEAKVEVVDNIGKWKKNNTGWWYENANGSYPQSEWKKINGSWYYFGNNGYMLESQWIGNYYVGSNGAMLVNTTTPDGYKVDENGKWIEERQAMWKKNNTGWWYENADGSYPQSEWKKINGSWYYFGNNGYMLESQWIGNYYVGSNGAMLVNTTTPDGYKVDENGKWIEERQAMWKKNNTGWWYENADGSYPQSEWKKINGSWYYFGNNGYMLENQWIGNYYVGSNGAMLVNTTTPDGYEVDENGKWIENQYSNENETNSDSSNNQYHNERFKSLVSQGLTEKEAELAERINEYRRQLGLREFSISKSLTKVARTHVIDSNKYHPEKQYDSRGIKGNLHSWSNHGNWTPVVYTPDHEYARNMWSKPAEISEYKDTGYEIAYINTYNLTAKSALDGWKGSKLHNDVIIGTGFWSNLKVMGVGIDGDYSFVWFGESENDPAGFYWENK